MIILMMLIPVSPIQNPGYNEKAYDACVDSAYDYDCDDDAIIELFDQLESEKENEQ